MIEAEIPFSAALQSAAGRIQNRLETKVLGRDKICAVVAAASAPAMLRQLIRALHITHTVELRLDWLADDREIERFLALLSHQRRRATFIATCRRVDAGGRYRGTIARQLTHLEQAIRVGCAWYDLEIETIRRCPPELLAVLLGDGRRLASAHFFQHMPRNLQRVAAELWRGHPDAVKIAANCDSLAAARKLLSLASSRKSVVIVPMGDVAQPARALSIREGSAFTYAPVENATAPGQTSLEQMKRVYRVDRLSRRTRVYGVIGDPIGQSISPWFHNAGFAARHVDAIFLPFLVHDLKDFVASIQPLGIRGFSITLPHKERILRHLDGCDPLAAKIGAVNTVVVRGGGKLYGYNTDYVGVLRTLESRMPLQGSRVLIVGAGGAARAVAFALSQAGASVWVCARRPARAKMLARAVGGEAIARPRLRSEFFDAIVNATPVGMHALAGQSPLEARELNCRLVFDTIYRPRVTRLLQLAAKRRIGTVSGVEMFVAQGTAQWEIWMGERAPAKVMQRAALRALADAEKAHGRGQSRTI